MKCSCFRQGRLVPVLSLLLGALSLAVKDSVLVSAWTMPGGGNGGISLKRRSATSAVSAEADGNEAGKGKSTGPVLVVGATGRVGRLVVQQLTAQGRPVRALVRNPDKAKSVFSAVTAPSSSPLSDPSLEIVVADFADYERYDEVLDKAVDGCDCIISVMGSSRVSKLSDFLPWRLFGTSAEWARGGGDASSSNHPYFCNYLGHLRLLELAEKHDVKRFVRLHGLAMAYPVYNPIVILFNTLLSFSNRWTVLFEQALFRSKVPYVVLRPGGLAEEERKTDTTNLQVDASGRLPLPSRVGRHDVAALAVSAVTDLPDDAPSYTLACRWCGPDVKPRPQGVKGDGFPNAKECYDNLIETNAESIPPPKMQPYGLAVGLTVYTAGGLLLKLGLTLLQLAGKLIRG